MKFKDGRGHCSPGTPSRTGRYHDDGRRIGTMKTVVWVVSLALSSTALIATSNAAVGSNGAGSRDKSALRDGQHDFDFDFGRWKTRSSRLLHPLTGSTTWVDMDGTTVVSKVWGGRANLAEFKADGPAGHLELLSLRTYNPAARQWSLAFATPNVGVLGTPSVGEFTNGRGVFYDQEPINGKSVLVRFSIWGITANTAQSEQAFSNDGGKTWEVNWINRYTRESTSNAPPVSSPGESAVRDGEHDFDFEPGVWTTHLKRLVHPLTGSTTWAEYDGTTTVRPVWDGRANLVELEVNGPAGHIEGLSLRLYNPHSHQWSLNFSNSSIGTLSSPTIGDFKNGRGEFFDQEDLDGRSIFVRFIISDITPDSVHFEQSYSSDGGKNWEANWIATDTRVTHPKDPAR